MHKHEIQYNIYESHNNNKSTKVDRIQKMPWVVGMLTGSTKYLF